MLHWIRKKLRPPLPSGEPYATNPTPENLYALLKRQCPVCGLKPPDWTDGYVSSDVLCARCSAHYHLNQNSRMATPYAR